MSMNGGTQGQLSGLQGSPDGRFFLLYAEGYLSSISNLLYPLYSPYASSLYWGFLLVYLFVCSRMEKVREVGIEPTETAFYSREDVDPT